MSYENGDRVDLELSVSETLIYNNSVGSEWDNWHSIRYRGNKYYCDPGDTITIPYYLGDEIELHSYVCEQENYPDVCYYSSYDTITAAEAKDGEDRGWYHTLTVVEDNGRYAGNSAQWRIDFDLHIDPEPTPRPSPTSTPYVWPTRTPKPNVPLVASTVSPTPAIEISGASHVDTSQNKTANASLGLYWIYFFAALLLIAIIARVTTLVRETKEQREERKQLKADNRRVESEIKLIIKTLDIYDKLDILEYLEDLYKK